MTKGFDHHLAMYANSHMSRAGAKLLCSKLNLEYNDDPTEDHFAVWSSHIVRHLRKTHTDEEVARIIINHLPLMANRLLFMDLESSCSTFISGVINTIERECHKRLRKLLLTLFNNENILDFLLKNMLVSGSLPDKKLPSHEFIFFICTLLMQFGSVNSRFFSLLIRERPNQKQNIVSAADYFGIAAEDILPTSIDDDDDFNTTHSHKNSSMYDPNHLIRECVPRATLRELVRCNATINTKHQPLKIMEQLHTGQIGEIWTAIDIREKRTVVLKIVSISDTSQASHAVHSWCRAIAATNTLHDISGVAHPLTGVELWQGVVYYVLPYYQRGTLYDAVVRRSTDVYALLSGLIGVVKAVSVAHQKFILHRDIAPRNILLNDQLGMALSDWENSASSAFAMKNSSSEFWGTEGFAAPELRSDSNSSSDVRSDIYSMAQTIIFCFLGNNFLLGNRRAALTDVCYNSELVEVLCRGSELIAANRHDSMAEFHTALVNALRTTIVSSDLAHEETTSPQPFRQPSDFATMLEHLLGPHVHASLYDAVYWTIAFVVVSLMLGAALVLRMFLW